MSRRILVTGCTGLVGHGVCESLLALGHEVWGTARCALRTQHERFHPLLFDLSQSQDFGSHLASLPPLDAVIHTAAKLPLSGPESWEDELEFFRLNFSATHHLLQACAQNNVGAFILISSLGGLDSGHHSLREETPFKTTNAYHSSKAMAEIITTQFSEQRRLRTVVLRISAPYGYTGRAIAVIPRFISLAKRGEPLPLWGTGGRKQTFTFVEDIGLACAAAVEANVSGTFHITGPEAVTMKMLAEEVLQAFPGTGSSIVFTGKADPQEGQEQLHDSDKAKRLLGFEPRHTLAQGLARIASATTEAMAYRREAP